MRLPVRLYSIVILISSMSLTAQTKKDVPLSPEKQTLLKERDQLLQQVQGEFQERKYSEAMITFSKIVAVEKRLYGETDQKVITRLKQVSQLCEALGNWQQAQQALKETLTILTQKVGKDHYNTQDAQRAILQLAFRQKLSPQQRQLLRQANQLNAQIRQLHRSGRTKTAIPLALKVIDIQKQVLGEKHPDYARTLNNLAEMYRTERQYDKALPLIQQAIAIRKKVLGEKHPEFAITLHTLASLYLFQGKYEKALLLSKQSLTIFKQVLGEKHPVYVTSLNNLAEVYFSQGEYDKALPHFKRALTLKKELFGTKHLSYARGLNNLALLYRSTGEYNKALPLFEQAVSLLKELLGDKHLEYAQFLHNLAGLYQLQGEYEKAQPLMQQILDLRQKVLGEKHPHYAQSLSSLALLYRAQGEYDKALPIFQQALELIKEAWGEKHPNFVISLNNLALQYHSQGEYGKAFPLYQQVLALRKEILGEKHPSYATSLNNIADLYISQGEYAKALPLCQQATTLSKAVLGEKHPEYATSLNALATLYRSQGEYAKALPLYQQALIIIKESLGVKHPRYALSLTNLATLFEKMGAYDKAMPLHQQALSLTKEVSGERHPHYALCLNNLAGVYSIRGEYAKALPLYQQALRLIREFSDEKNPLYSLFLNGIAFLYYAQEDYTNAEKYLLQGAKAFLETRLQVSQEGLQRASHTSEHSYIPTLAGVLACNGKVNAAWYWLEQSLGRATRDEVVARNARTQQEQHQLDQIQGSIQQTEQRLKQLAFAPKLTTDQKQLQKRLLSEQGKRYARLTELYNQLQAKYGITEGKPYSLSHLQSTLPKETAFLTWIDAEKEHWVVLVRSQGHPVFRQIKGQKSNWSIEDSALPTKLYLLLQSQRQSKRAELKALIQQLKMQRIGPIAKYLKGLKHLVILPSGLMDKIPVELLLPEKKVSYAPSATMYAYLKSQQPPKSTRLLALGDPIFNPEELGERPLPDGGILINSVIANSSAEKVGLRAEQVLLAYNNSPVNTLDEFSKAQATAQALKEVRIRIWDEGRTFEKVIPTGQIGVLLSKSPVKIALQYRRKEHWHLVSRGDEWSALPGTRFEVVSIANLMNRDKRQVLLDSEASEQRLYQLASTGKLKEFRYLHFATHGQVNGRQPMGSALLLSRDKLKSNIDALKPNEPYFDGRLTAKEVALNWTLDTDLVTLSACKSGLGKHAMGEGFMGFSQVFLTRGSRSVVLSLWSVDDTATALLMSRFYENLIKKEMSKIDALTEAKKWLRTLPRSEVLKLAGSMSNGIARGPGRKKLPPLTKVPTPKKEEDAPYAHPYYWSTFILIGDTQ